MEDINKKLEGMENALNAHARAFAKHSGPTSGERERETFARDLRSAALRYARAYYAVAREYGLIPEYERTGAAIEGADLATSDPRDLTDDELSGMLRAARRLDRHQVYGMKCVMAELGRHRALLRDMREVVSAVYGADGRRVYSDLDAAAGMHRIATFLGAKP